MDRTTAKQFEYYSTGRDVFDFYRPDVAMDEVLQPAQLTATEIASPGVEVKKEVEKPPPVAGGNIDLSHLLRQVMVRASK